MSEQDERKLRLLWLEQPAAAAPIKIDSLRRQANGLAWKVKLRNAVDYIAAALGVIGIAIVVWTKRQGTLGAVDWGTAIAAILGSLYFLYYLRKHGRALALRVDGDIRVGLQSVISEYRRQRDLHLAAFNWYIAPFLPAFAIFFATHVDAWSRKEALQYVVWIAAAVYTPLWWHKRVAERLQRSIDVLEAAHKSIVE